MTAKRWNNVSLATRLACLYALLLAVLLGALGAFFYFETRAFLHSSTAVRLRAQAKPVIERELAPALAQARSAAEARHALASIAGELSRALTSRDTLASILDAGGNMLAEGRQLPEEPAPVGADSAQVLRALAGNNEVTYLVPAEEGAAGSGPDAVDRLVLLIPLRSAPGERIDGVAQLVTPLAQVEEILLRERVVIVLGVLVALVAGAAAGLWLTRRGLAPLRRMIEICRRIAAGDLSQRVHLATQRDEVGQLADAFDDMVARIETSFAAQQRFLADAAHELRTPLAALQGSLEVFLRGAEGLPNSQQHVLAQGMYREARRLTGLAEQLLDLSTVDAGPAPTLRTVDAAEALGQFMQAAGPLARGRDFKLQPGAPLALCVDTALLQQALFHMVDNAAKHTRAGGSITLGWEREGDMAKLWVADDGEGIAEEHLAHVFEPFYRGDRSRSRVRGGTGLGLALVERITHAHGGAVHVESTPSQGARFTLLLPVARPTGSRA